MSKIQKLMAQRLETQRATAAPAAEQPPIEVPAWLTPTQAEAYRRGVRMAHEARAVAEDGGGGGA